jgi:hypothetical protein
MQSHQRKGTNEELVTPVYMKITGWGGKAILSGFCIGPNAFVYTGVFLVFPGLLSVCIVAFSVCYGAKEILLPCFLFATNRFLSARTPR